MTKKGNVFCGEEETKMVGSRLDRPLALGGLAGGDSGVEVGGLFARDGQRSPLSGCGGEVFGEEGDLAHVISVMRDLTIDSLRDGVRFGANGDCTREVRIGQLLERVKKILPALLPQGQNLRARFGRRVVLRVAVAVGLLGVGGVEFGAARAHVSRQVLHDDGDGV